MNIPRQPIVLTLAAALAAAGCQDPFEPEPTPVPGPESHVLHDFRAGPLVEPSAFDLFSAAPVRTDQSSSWDLLFFVTAGGDPQLRPRNVVVGDGSTAGLQPVQTAFDELLEVPEGDYTADSPIPVEAGVVYAARSRRSGGCTRFGKLSVDSVDATEGRLFVTTVVNPNCNDRSVEPAETDTTDGNQGDEGS